MKESIQSIQVNTGSGETGVVEIPLHHRTSRRDWQSRYLTADCLPCPFFVPSEELHKIIPSLETSKVMRITIPENIDGICTVGQEQKYDSLTHYPPVPLEKYIIHKFLVRNRFHPVQGCKNPSREKRLIRAEERRAEGKLKFRIK